MSLRVAVHESWQQVPVHEWDQLMEPVTPFLESAWLANLERSGAAGPATGWTPRVVTVHDGARLVAGAPAWKVDHHEAQWVYVGHWVNAAERARIPLLPKLVLAIPYTPVPGERIHIAPDHADDPKVRAALWAGVEQAAAGCTGVHALFPEPLTGLPRSFVREQFVYRWINRGYRDWEDWLAALRSDRRKEMRRDRREISGYAVEVVPDPDAATLALLHRVYAATAARYDQEQPFFNEAFYLGLEGWKGRVYAVVARKGDRPIGASLLVHKGRRLYGRTWGILEPAPFLHFELCFYQGIEMAIRLGLESFDPGYGGEQKLRRGFEPVVTWSEHHFAHAGVQQSFQRAAAHEARYMAEARETAALSLPFRQAAGAKADP